jgi:hypothetical protein
MQNFGSLKMNLVERNCKVWEERHVGEGSANGNSLQVGKGITENYCVE